MGRYMSILSMLSSVILRKCIHVYQEYVYLLMDMAFILVSSVQFSTMTFRPTAVVSGRISSMTPMMARLPR
ncbi:hypothetical protein Lalb_Chr12g0207521 [Lupinus albus]|uniref:Uncharacterized protein n=1 Tax=Lupinus albus TaxID=3870 RepID=A0A6A4PNS9_LUPAL|nr:hypothetical protein Lalb_Chr12g0207521 [Lupinus albus]